MGLSYQVTPTSLKERITVASAAAAASLASLSFIVRAGGGLVPYRRPDGSVAFSRDGAGGVPAAIMPKPFMTDARPAAQSPYGLAWSPDAAQQATWDQATGTMRVTVTADPAWLHQPARRFPRAEHDDHLGFGAGYVELQLELAAVGGHRFRRRGGAYPPGVSISVGRIQGAGQTPTPRRWRSFTPTRLAMSRSEGW